MGKIRSNNVHVIRSVGYSASKFKISKRLDEWLVRYGRLKRSGRFFLRELKVSCVLRVLL